MSSSAITTQVAQLKIGSVQNQADTSSVYSAGVWSFKNSTALTSVTITDAGNVGINAVSPTSRLTIGTGTFTAAAAQTTGMYTNGTNGLVVLTDAMSVNSRTGTNFLNIDASGNLLVGTTTATNTRLAVKATGTNGNTANIENANNANGDQALTLGLGSNANNTSSYFLICQTPGVANRLFIFGNGNVVNTNSSYGALSDIKLKENIVDATPKLENLCKVRIVNYNLKTEPNQKLIGVVAQELEQVFPGLVDESSDIDAEGNETGEVTKSVKYSVFVPILVKAIQELSAKNDALEARLAALEAK